MSFLAPLLGGLFSGLLGGAAGSANTRPPALNPTQTNALNGLIPSLMPTATGTPKIDPIQQALMYGQIAQSRTGADTGITHSLVSRGLGRSGILGDALIQNQNKAQQSQNEANLTLQQQAVQQKQLSIQDLLGLLNVNATPGQSKGGGFLNGLAPVLAYSIQNMVNSRNSGNGSSFPGGVIPMYNPTLENTPPNNFNGLPAV
jgi:hypothetical protein